jgi:hypothetical protein
MMMEKLNVLTLPEKLIAGGGVLMFIASFFSWIGYQEFGYDGWSWPGSTWSTLAILVSIVLAAVVLATRVWNVKMPDLPENLTWGKVFGGGAAAVAVLMLLKAWRILAAPAGSFDIGFFIALIATAMIVYGGYMLYNQEKTGMPSQ